MCQPTYATRYSNGYYACRDPFYRLPVVCILPVLTFLTCLLEPPACQLVFGLERLVDMTIAKKVPPIAYATTVGIRFCNNVIGEWRPGGRGRARRIRAWGDGMQWCMEAPGAVAVYSQPLLY